MEILWSGVVAILMTCGIYLMMERHILRIIFGVILLSNAINLSILVAGRLGEGIPPLIQDGALTPPENFANPLTQVLILTAIVIGFGLIIFALILAYRAHYETDTADVDAMCLAERDET